VSQTIDNLVQTHLKPNGPGAAIGVLQAGRQLHRGGYGLASLEWNTPIQSDTVFRIASLTKQFTAMAILMLQEQGKLHIDDLLSAYLPDCPPAWQTIRLKHLLTHTAGLVNITELPTFQERAAQALSLQDVIALFMPIPLLFEPGSDFYYSNSGYHLLGLIVERISGTSYEEFIRTNIFEALGMQRSCFHHNTPIIPKRASGYALSSEGITPALWVNPISTHSSGAIESTLDDLFLWEQALRESRLVNAELQTLMFQPLRLPDGRTIEYGFGWSFSTYRGKALICHGGLTYGFRSLVAKFLEDDLTIIVLTNYRDFPIERVALEIAAQYVAFPPLTRQALSQEIGSFKKIVGSYDLSGSHIEVTERDQRILLRRGAKEVVLFPVSETEFVPETNHDVAYRFMEERDETFHSLMITYPLHFSIAKRKAHQQ
jgi:CubicO group peptidase (beta-lactamase class C family)